MRNYCLSKKKNIFVVTSNKRKHNELSQVDSNKFLADQDTRLSNDSNQNDKGGSESNVGTCNDKAFDESV